MKAWLKRQRIFWVEQRVKYLNEQYTMYALRGDVVHSKEIALRLFAAEDRLAELQGRDNHPSNGSEAVLAQTPRAESLFEALTVSGQYDEILPNLISIDERVGR